MRRKRCPYCKSLNTVECTGGNKTEGLTMLGRVCDDCDQGFDTRHLENGKWVKIPDLEMPRRPHVKAG